jgi:Ca2+-binding EF-hand superfamily protein
MCYITPNYLIDSEGHDADEREIDEMIRNFDTDGKHTYNAESCSLHVGNGEIDFQEFCEMMASRIVQQSNQPEQLIHEVFAVFDGTTCEHPCLVLRSYLYF